MDKTKAMLSESGLPKKLWGYAVCSAAYTLNRSPTAALHGDIPARRWFGKNDIRKIEYLDAKHMFMYLIRKAS